VSDVDWTRRQLEANSAQIHRDAEQKAMREREQAPKHVIDYYKDHILDTAEPADLADTIGALLDAGHKPDDLMQHAQAHKENPFLWDEFPPSCSEFYAPDGPWKRYADALAKPMFAF
jgi:hypothetical protein